MVTRKTPPAVPAAPAPPEGGALRRARQFAASRGLPPPQPEIETPKGKPTAPRKKTAAKPGKR
jgi:hypothetical protein